ncbi:MAG: hypothetical protein LBC74_01850 [Planctomycetaceae bacterium]|nr:hypothetical protein [Planctomycetaceae bacterium]
MVIQTEIYKKRTGREDIDKEGSFYCFFNEELFRYMSEPYREDVSSTITIIENEEGDLVATETIEYTCRAGKNGIQREIKYAHDTEIAEYHALTKIVVLVIRPFL